MSPVDVAIPAAATVALPMRTLIRILAVLEDAEQVYGDLLVVGLAEPEDATAAARVSAMYAELDALRVGPREHTTEVCDDCTEYPCSAHPWPGMAAGRHTPTQEDR